jgi:hypothetical protein
MAAIIRTFGLWWDNRLVEWKGVAGPGGRRPNLWGGPKPNSKQENWVDFWEQVGFYALHDESERLVYVGQVGRGDQRLGARLRQHLSDPLMGRWRYFSWFGLGWVNEGGSLKAEAENFAAKREEVLDPVEVVLIHLTEPRLNRSWGNSSKHGMERYFQPGRQSTWLAKMNEWEASDGDLGDEEGGDDE